jgi:NADP-dependent 3-hydroxy acid dehydrogenase YdfG
MSNQLAGKIAWVTGGGSGIGRAAARALAREGAHVVLSGRRPAELEHTVREFTAEGLTASSVPLDVSDSAAVAKAAATIAESIGTVGILVCSAGLNVPGRFWKDVTLDDYTRIVGVNLNGVVHCTHAVLPGMRARQDGVIVIVSSWAGREFLPIAGMAYGASKSALSPLTEAINCEEGRNGIRATLIMPGEVATPILMTRPVPPSAQDLEKMLQPEDLADLIRYVAVAPRRVCLGEVLIGPSWNRIYIGADDMRLDAR